MRRIALILTLTGLLLTAALALGQAGSPAADNPGLEISVGGHTCSLVLANTLADAAAITPAATTEATSEAAPEAAPAATAEPTYPLLTLGDDCFEVAAYLGVPSNDVLWIALALPNEPTWQRFSIDPADKFPPKLDRRGRFVGCTIPEQGAQTCRVLWENFGTTYAIEIPLSVRQPYIPPPATNTPVAPAAPAVVPAAPISTAVPVSTPNNSGLWGDCGSCTTCGGPVEHCVLAPDNTCVWDAARCEH